ncbi:MAG: hypothetical protein KF753_19950 [Caldilineaceae bacterium]|nr:hypothetical protein [Caldilineaceae bacterium]
MDSGLGLAMICLVDKDIAQHAAMLMRESGSRTALSLPAQTTDLYQSIGLL